MGKSVLSGVAPLVMSSRVNISPTYLQASVLAEKSPEPKNPLVSARQFFFQFFLLASLVSKIHQRNLRERCRGCGKKGGMGLEKMGKLSRIVPFFSDFLLVPINFTHL